MGLNVPPAFAAFNARTGYSAALIEWFYRDGAEVFMLGGDFMQMVHEGFDRVRGTQHNLQDVELLMRLLARTKALNQNWRQRWVEALLFDALIENSDRHQDNWGLIFDAVGREPPNMPPCRLAPLFDNGTSLGHERFPDRVAGWSSARLDQYIANGMHHVKSSLDPALAVQGHLQLLRHVLNDWGQHLDLDLLRDRVAFSSDELILCFADLGSIPVPVPMTT